MMASWTSSRLIELWTPPYFITDLIIAQLKNIRWTKAGDFYAETHGWKCIDGI